VHAVVVAEKGTRAEVSRKTLFRVIPLALFVLILISWIIIPGQFAHGMIVGFLSTLVLIFGSLAIGSRVLKRRLGGQLSPPSLPTGAWDYVMDATDLSGAPVNLSELSGKALVLNFWATWCAPCVAEMPNLQRLRDKTSDLDVQFACVTREPVELVRKFVEKRGIDLPVYVLGTEPPECFKSRAIPATFVLDKKGMIVMRHFGAARWDAEEIVVFVRGLAAAPE
jgi:thiol-disulfide isomerase/thioredoxin